jgi:hypothetical protein
MNVHISAGQAATVEEVRFLGLPTWIKANRANTGRTTTRHANQQDRVRVWGEGGHDSYHADVGVVAEA